VPLLNSNGVMGSVTLAPWSNRLYCLFSSAAAGTGLYVLDCATDSVIGRTPIQLHYGAGTLAAYPDNYRIYLAAYYESCVYVYRDEPNPIAEQAAPPQTPRLTFSVAPNPTRGTIRTVLPSSLPPSTLSVFDCSGSFVRSFDIGPSSFDIADLRSGVYVLRLRTADGRTATTRFTLLR
jgi:hypothetical protein